MARCDYCDSMILFGGKKQGSRTFCNEKCLTKGYLIIAADRLPQHAVDEAVDEVHLGECPECGGPGPVDVHVSHSVWSVVYLTSWKSTPHLCCRSCGRKKQLGGLLFSGALGWWGFPWGLIMAPIQVGRNISGILGGPAPDVASEQLETMVRIDLAERVERGEPLPGGRSQPRQSAAVSEEPIAVECDACGKRFKAKAKLAGRSGKCPGCGSPITVPKPEVDEWDTADDVWEDAEDVNYDAYDDDGYDNPYAADHDDWNDRPARRKSRRQPKKKSASTLIIVLAAITFGLFAIGAVAAVGILLFDRPNQQGMPPIAQNDPPQIPNLPQPNVRQPDLIPQNINPAAFQPSEAATPLLPDNASPNPADVTSPIANATVEPGTTTLAEPTSNEAANTNDTPHPPAAVKPLPNVNTSGRLWVVLSDLREAPGNRISAFNRPFLVNYQLASGTPNDATKYVLHVASTRGSGSVSFYVDIPVRIGASGTIEFRTPPTFGPGNDFKAVMAIAKARNKWTELSGQIAPGGAATVAQAPPTIREQAGAQAAGKLLAIANPEFSNDNGPFPTLKVGFVLQGQASPSGYYFLVIEKPDGQRVEFDIARTLRQADQDDEGTLGGRLLGPGAQIKPPFTLHVEKRNSRISSRLRPETPEVVSNKVSLAN
ncbi:MAG: hypothetical protein ACYTGL_06550 [Planctomycetota bacterium]|jgi:hypothetical protein